MAKAILKKTREARVYSGHPWVFRSDVVQMNGDYAPGDVVEVESAKGTFLGRAFCNPNSQIMLRMLTTEDEPVDADFFRRRVRRAWAYRTRFCDVNSCRAVFSESDFLPGLVVDKFSDILVVQSLSLGIERWKDVLIDELMAVTGARGVYERNDVPVRRLEGMEQITGVPVLGLMPYIPLTIEDEDSLIDPATGAKPAQSMDAMEAQFDFLADSMEAHLDVGRILHIMELEAK